MRFNAVTMTLLGGLLATTVACRTQTQTPSNSSTSTSARATSSATSTEAGRSSGPSGTTVLRAGSPADNTAERAAERSTELRWREHAYPTGKVASSAIKVAKGVPAQIRLNQPPTYEIHVTNLTDHNLHDLSVVEEVSEGFELASSSPTARTKANKLGFMLGDLAPGATRRIEITGEAKSGGSFESCAEVSYNESLCSDTPIVNPELRLTKSGPAEDLLCHEVQWTYTVANTGTGSIRNVTVRDQLPAGMTTTSGQRLVTRTFEELRPGASEQFSVKLRGTKTGRFASKASAVGADGSKADSAEVATQLKAPVLQVAISGPSRAFIGRTAEYEITVTNTGDGMSPKTQLVLPTGSEMVRASDTPKTTRGQLAWSLGDLAPRASKTVKVTLRSSVAGNTPLRVVASSHCAPADGYASTTTEWKGIPAILLEVVDLEDPILVGQDETYLITCTNQGSAPGTNIRITCTMEDSQSFTSSQGSTKSAVSGSTITFAPLPSLAPGEKAVWRVNVRSLEVADIRFKVSMISDQLTRPVEETEATNLYE